MASVAGLYTPAVLALAVSLADYPLDDTLVRRGEARSATCGSRVTVGLAVDATGRIGGIGVAASACAIGQAAAAIFARGTVGRDAANIAAAQREIAAWLAGEGQLPGWPGLAEIAAAVPFPARHGAIMLAWNAAALALSYAPIAG